MQDFHYNYIKNNHDDKVEMLLTDAYFSEDCHKDKKLSKTIKILQ